MRKAVICLSGGMDSATCLAVARGAGFACYALSFNYGQRAEVELQAAQATCQHQNVAAHKIIPLTLGDLTSSALTSRDLDLPDQVNDDIPVSYVPARNTIMLSIALGWAEVLGARDIYLGATAIDYDCYPDCRPEYLQAFEKMANLATKAGVMGDCFTLHAPLLKLTKAEIVKLGQSLGVDYTKTVSCYDPDQQGRACRVCQSCQLRAQGFAEAGIEDPTVYA